MAARGSYDPDITVGQSHLPMPIVGVNFGQDWGRGDYKNPRNH